MAEKQLLGDLLLESKLISHVDLEKALRLQVGGNRRLGYLLIKMGLITEDQLHSVLSRQMDLPIVDIDEEFNPEVKSILPRYLCWKYSFLPLKLGEHNTLKAAMVEPSDFEAVSDIEKYTGKVIKPVLASKSAISSNINKKIPRSFRDALNPKIANKFKILFATLAALLVVALAVQNYQERQFEKYGKVSSSPQKTSYENLELILGFDEQNNISLLGRGAYSSGYYSVTFGDLQALQSFLVVKKKDFSQHQLEWLQWAMTNPYGNY